MSRARVHPELSLRAERSHLDGGGTLPVRTNMLPSADSKKSETAHETRVLRV